MEKQELLDQVKQDILNNLTCPLKDAATNLVFGKGNIDAEILFIGEAPGEQEDLQGIPFVGRAGKELDKLLRTIGLGIDDVYIANILKYRPPKNRDPNPEEIASHTPFLVRQIEIIKPKVILTLGNFSTKFVLAGCSVDGMNKVPGITNIHGKTKEVMLDGEMVTIIPMYHPAAMLYRPQLREVIESDFLQVASFLGRTVKEKQQGLGEFQ